MSTQVKIYNNSTEDLTVGVFGEGSNATFRKVLNAGGRHVATFFAWDRVFVAWDEFQDIFYPDPSLAVASTGLPDNKKVTAKFNENAGWVFAILAVGQDFPND
jgi:hypothetical protein